jgi:hypothetical protein
MFLNLEFKMKKQFVDFIINYFLGGRNNITIIVIVYSLVLMYIILRGFAYRKLQGNNYGFIPIIGDLLCVEIISSKVKSRYRVAYCIASFLQIIFSELLFSTLNEPTDVPLFIFFVFIPEILLYFTIFIISTIISTIFKYVILDTLKTKIPSYKDRGYFTFLFTCIPLLLYIWILSQKSLEEWDEINI